MATVLWNMIKPLITKFSHNIKASEMPPSLGVIDIEWYYRDRLEHPRNLTPLFFRGKECGIKACFLWLPNFQVSELINRWVCLRLYTCRQQDLAWCYWKFNAVMVWRRATSHTDTVFNKWMYNLGIGVIKPLSEWKDGCLIYLSINFTS